MMAGTVWTKRQREYDKPDQEFHSPASSAFSLSMTIVRMNSAGDISAQKRSMRMRSAPLKDALHCHESRSPSGNGFRPAIGFFSLDIYNYHCHVRRHCR